MTAKEFYEKHCLIMKEGKSVRPKLFEIDLHFFETMEYLRKEGKTLINAHRRTSNYEGYLRSLQITGFDLFSGKKVYLMTQHPEQFIADLKNIYGISVDSCAENGFTTITLKQE